ncbi:MAG: hypothetical protein JSW41_02130 [Candidatus Aenigmatarchaeota archaeon]|nr:MAG: hypothetical protein JSW41_02130 [Candidatus Aenigmarchaeota archaeon]
MIEKEDRLIIIFIGVLWFGILISHYNILFGISVVIVACLYGFGVDKNDARNRRKPD